MRNSIRARSVDLPAFFQDARGSQVVREVDPVLYDRPWIGRPSRTGRTIRLGDHRDHHSMAKCMLLAARLTGVKLTLAEVTSQAGAVAVGVRG